ncbi:hypothetical protein RB595_000255 [Gaeumannomyces hyphopodioides]
MRATSLLSALAVASAPLIASGSPSKARGAHVVRDSYAVAAEYDYVIVGGGTAGLTVADRLTEDGKTTVLVLEHGQFVNDSAISTVQGGFAAIQDKYMYSINSVPQPNLENRRTQVFIGKLVGGSSAINAMMTIRGTAEDYDRWGGFFGPGSSWSWDGLLPYFKKALHFTPPDPATAAASEIRYDESYWGKTSGVHAGFPSFQYPGVKAIIDGFKSMPGVTFTSDSGDGKTGVYWYPQFSHPETVTRSYARTGHWDDISRSNYHLKAGVKVSKILLEGTKATGVAYAEVGEDAGSKVVKTVRARREVILAAGGIHTPQIMQLSGLGPKKVLEAAKIPTVVDLPGVGQNFQDHVMLTAMFNLRNFTFSPNANDLATNPTFKAWADQLWAANRTGPYSLASGTAAAWLSFPVISPRAGEIADALAAQDPAASLPAGTHPDVVRGYGAQMASYAAAMRSNGTAFYNFITNGAPSSGGPLISLHPLSRGSVNVDPADPEGREPIVDYGALTNPLDRDVNIELLKYTRRFFLENPAMAAYAPAEAQPGRNVTTRKQLDRWLETTLRPTVYHPVGTCAMMPREMGGVVDQELKVYGVQGLRIVDGSIMPTLVGANTCQTVYAVAEKVRDSWFFCVVDDSRADLFASRLRI